MAGILAEVSHEWKHRITSLGRWHRCSWLAIYLCRLCSCCFSFDHFSFATSTLLDYERQLLLDLRLSTTNLDDFDHNEQSPGPPWMLPMEYVQSNCWKLKPLLHFLLKLLQLIIIWSIPIKLLCPSHFISTHQLFIHGSCWAPLGSVGWARFSQWAHLLLLFL